MRFDKNVIEMLKNSKNVAIFTHKRPDGDCFGAASALKQALSQLGVCSDIYCDGIINDNYLFIKHIDEVNKPALESYDLGVAVDCSDLNRLGKYASLFSTIKNTIKIDHHKTAEDFAKLNHVEIVGSTCEILYDLLIELEIKFDADIANSLYAGVAADTGCFMHDSTTTRTHFVAGELLKYGFDLDKANYLLFKRKTIGQINLLSRALSHIRFICDKKVAISYLTRKDFQEFGCANTETFGIVNTCADIDIVDIGVLISEDKPGLYTCSFRGRGRVDVSKICEEFGGGGHVRASGCNIYGTYNTVIKKIEKVVNDYYARIS